MRLARVARPTPSDEGPSAVVEACPGALIGARHSALGQIRTALAVVGISRPGPVDPTAATAVVAPRNLGARFRGVFDVRRIIDGSSIAERPSDRLLGRARCDIDVHAFSRQTARVTLLPAKPGARRARVLAEPGAGVSPAGALFLSSPPALPNRADAAANQRHSGRC